MPIVEVTTHTHFPIKLNSSNFLVWRKQVITTLTGLGLDSYVNGDTVAPSKLLATDNTKANPAYLPWFRQDQIILGEILSSCSETIQSVVSSAESARKAFQRLTESYASVSRSRIISLKSRLANNPKGTRSITEFLHDMKHIADELALAQSPVDEEDLVVHILGQLGDEYAHIASALKIRDTPIKFPDLFEKLIDHKRTLKDSAAPSVITTVNNTQKQSSRYPPKFSYDNCNLPKFNTNTNSGARQSRPPTHFNGGNNNQRGNRNPSYCQYCNIPGHDTKECRKLAQFLRENNITISMNSPHNPMINTSSSGQPSSTPPWMFDSGASHHVASNPASFHTLSDYGGPDEIVLGIGKTLPISHTGSTHGRNSHAGVNINDIYYAAIRSLQHLPRVNSTITSTSSLGSWHHKLGHPSIKVFKLRLGHLGLSCNQNSFVSFHCNACSINKSHKLPFGSNSFQASKPLQLVYSDVWGPVQQSNDGFTYYVTFVDYYSRYIWLYPMKRKSDVSTLFPQFRSLVEKYYNTSLVSLFTDNGGEYIKLTSYLQQNGISHFTTPPHTPEQNGITERRLRHIVETGLALLHHANLPLTFWTYDFQTAVHLINRLPTPVLQLQSPYDKLHNTTPTYHKLKPFGCLCYPWLRPYSSSKLHPRLAKCIFLGYSSSKSAYKCYEPTSHRLYYSRHIEFIEHIYPYHTESPTILPTTDSFSSKPTTTSDDTPTTPSDTCYPPPTSTHTIPDLIPQPPPTSPTPPLVHPSPPPSPPPPTPAATTSTFHPRRTRKPNKKYFNDNLINTTSLHPIPPALEPSTHTQALKDPKWRHAMESEFNALIQNQTWELVPPSSHTPIGCKWVFRIKRNPDRSISKYKARLVAKGFLQQHGKDYFETFSPVTKPVTIRIILFVALSKNWPLRQIDVNNAFLHGTLHEDVFMSQPPGYGHSREAWKRNTTEDMGEYIDHSINKSAGRSTTTYLLYLGTNIVSWKSTRQKSVSRSSTEAEYKAIANASPELIWLKNLLRELGVPCPATPTLFCDNTGATYLCANPVYHSRMKHVALDYHFVREQVTSGHLKVLHVHSQNQLAHMLTKPLLRAPFLRNRSKIGVSDGSSILRGHIKDIQPNSDPHQPNESQQPNEPIPSVYT
ncbi:hypothetical protein LXL04_025748 [Taraxacum kok-saghyz]